LQARAAAPPGLEVSPREGVAAVEWPTVLLAAVIYGGWLALTFWHAALPAWVVFPGLAWLIAWQGSLQHEVLHGHPTRVRAINDAIGFPPLSFWLPYGVYRPSHLRHHDDVRLTDPLDDPESRYWLPEQWGLLSSPGRFLVRLQNTFLGRLALGPAWAVGRFFYFQGRALWHFHPGAWRVWTPHLVGVAGVVLWLGLVCRLDPLLYVAFAVYPAVSLLLIRSFAEHKAASGVRERIAIVERAPVLGLLFLHNNLHLVHHAWPELPWYRIPALFRRHRACFLAANGGLVYDGYRDVARRFLFTSHDRLLHPLGRVPAEHI
jgi:fatty acid desaturase